MAANLTQSAQTLLPEPGRRSEAIQHLFNRAGELSIWGESAEGYLVHHVNKGLSVIPTELLDCFCLSAVGEDDLDQIDVPICGNGTTNQTFPCQGATTREKLVRTANMRFQDLGLQTARNFQRLWT